jgi:hypothetical protein
MRIKIRVSTVVLLSIALSVTAVAGDSDVQKALATAQFDTVRINLNPWGRHLGFEIEVEGGDPRLEVLLSVISSAEPSLDHKCANRGAIRFRLRGGGVIGVGLLPSHTDGFYQLRLYDGDRFRGVFSAQRKALLDALKGLGVPLDDPAFGS